MQTLSLSFPNIPAFDALNSHFSHLNQLSKKSQKPFQWKEEETHFALTVLAAGVNQDDIHLEQIDNMLLLRFNAKDEHVILSSEYKWNIPSFVDASQLSATLSKGLLKLILPKKEKQRTKFIVQTESQENLVEANQEIQIEK